MRLLLVHAQFPLSYWGFQLALPLAGKRASLPPLGLITVAAHLPASCELRLVDLNIEPLTDEDLRWADAVLVGGMRVQAPSIHEVVARARAAGRRTVVGGPAASSTPAEFTDADLVFVGEIEGRSEQLLAALEGRAGSRLLTPQGALPDLTSGPVPRFDLLAQGAYASMSIQYSRGCPYSCEFCDVIELFGRAPRVKGAPQVIAELSALRATGWSGTLFFVDDNFIGNQKAVRALLPQLRAWQEANGTPFELYTEASVNLAADPELTAALVEAGFSAVFVGIETPSVAALREAGKKHNLGVDLREAVDTLTRAGLEVMGGFIIGFDTDGPEAFGVMRDFLTAAPIPLSMVGLLAALPGTALWKRLQREGRLRTSCTGDAFDRPNFVPAMDEVELLDGYARFLRWLYSEDAYLERCLATLARTPAWRLSASRGRSRDVGTFLRCLWRLGITGKRRRLYWTLVTRALLKNPRALPWALGHVLQGEHLIRYTEEEVLPRLARARATVRTERARGVPVRVPLPLAVLAGCESSPPAA